MDEDLMERFCTVLECVCVFIRAVPRTTVLRLRVARVVKCFHSFPIRPVTDRTHPNTESAHASAASLSQTLVRFSSSPPPRPLFRLDVSYLSPSFFSSSFLSGGGID